MSIRIKILADDAQPQDIEISHATQSLAEILAAHGHPLNTRCGHRGLCQGCEVELRDGKLASAGNPVLPSPAAIRSCQTRVVEPVDIYIPARSRMDHRPQVTDTFRCDIPYAHQPLVAGEIAFAVDIGTTTVAVLLLDLQTGEVLSRASGFNEQIRLGDNVLTRIDHAATHPDGLRAMQQAVVKETLVPLLRRACEKAGRDVSALAGGTIAGNTTMLHLLMGVDPVSLGVMPFRPQFIDVKTTTAARLGLHKDFAADMPIFLLPGIAAYIGADIVAGVHASGMLYDERPSLLVDIGTNGEIVLQQDGKLFACATAAGPAFEGSGLRSGSRAREGAVSTIALCREPWGVTTEVIGNIPPARAVGICGSAYVNFLAEARRSELLSCMGRFESSVWETLPRTDRRMDDDTRALRIAGEQFISEVDVALLLQAKAAIGAGIEILLDRAGVAALELGKVYLAGGFGMHLHVPHAIAIGLLPGMLPEQVEVVGNTSLAGAMIALLDANCLPEMQSIPARVDVLELNLQADFEDRFIDHLLLP